MIKQNNQPIQIIKSAINHIVSQHTDSRFTDIEAIRSTLADIKAVCILGRALTELIKSEALIYLLCHEQTSDQRSTDLISFFVRSKMFLHPAAKPIEQPVNGGDSAFKAIIKTKLWKPIHHDHDHLIGVVRSDQH